MKRYVLGIDAGPRGIVAAIVAGDRVEILRAERGELERLVDTAVRGQGGRPDEIRVAGDGELPGATRVDAAIAVAHALDGTVAVCDGTTATMVRGGEIVVRAGGADTISALAAVLDGAAEPAAIVLIGPARHAEERVRRRFGRADVAADDAVAIGAATLPLARLWSDPPPPGGTSWTASPEASRMVPASAWGGAPQPPVVAEPAADAEPPVPAAARPPVAPRWILAGFALLVMLALFSASYSATVGVLSLTRDDDAAGATAGCQAAMNDGSDVLVHMACRVGDYVPHYAESCNWYLATNDSISCPLASEVFAAWNAERERDVVVPNQGRFVCEGRFILRCDGPGHARVYVMRALDLLR